MESGGEQQQVTSSETPMPNESEQNDEQMEESEDYSYEGEEYRHFMPRGRGGFR